MTRSLRRPANTPASAGRPRTTSASTAATVAIGSSRRRISTINARTRSQREAGPRTTADNAALSSSSISRPSRDVSLVGWPSSPRRAGRPTPRSRPVPDHGHGPAQRAGRVITRAAGTAAASRAMSSESEVITRPPPRRAQTATTCASARSTEPAPAPDSTAPTWRASAKSVSTTTTGGGGPAPSRRSGSEPVHGTPRRTRPLAQRGLPGEALDMNLQRLVNHGRQVLRVYFRICQSEWFAGRG